MTISYSDSRLRNLYYRFPAPAKSLLASTYSWRQRPNRFGGVFASQLSELQQARYRPQSERRNVQVTRLRRLLEHAGNSVPYYRDLFRSLGFDPRAVTSVDDLRALPLLDKETVRSKCDSLISSSERGRTIRVHTSGTTGKGLHLALSQEAYQRSYSCMWFHYSWAGIRRGNRVATFAGHPVTSPRVLRPPFWVNDWLERDMLFSSQHITPETLPLYADALAAFRPDVIRGYPSSIYPLALHLLETGRHLITPKAVFTSSETLFDHQRDAIEKAFGCNVYSYYSNTERAAHILECSEGRFHVLPEICVTEVLRPDGSPAVAGEEGELVCTSLIDRVAPLIRYRVGDTAVVGSAECGCGMHDQPLCSITGRVEDVVITPDGRHVGRLDHALKDALNVSEAQIVQEELGSIMVKLVPRSGFGPSDQRAILNELHLRLGYEIGIRFEIVDSIARTANGKFRFVVSKVRNRIGVKSVNQGVTAQGATSDES